MDEMRLLEQLKGAVHLPSTEVVCTGALERALSQYGDIDSIKSNFSRLVEEIEMEAHERYRDAERNACAGAFREVLRPLLPPAPQASDFFDLLERGFWAFDRFFLGLTQGRKPRAGKTFEQIIRVLFERLGYPYTAQPVINGQPDFLLPSVEHFRRNAMDCIIFTVKRTLRERWPQIITEGTQGYMFFLATIDEDIAARDLPRMLKNRIYVVVPDSVRVRRYPREANVISFERFFEQHLDPAMKRWRRNAVIK